MGITDGVQHDGISRRGNALRRRVATARAGGGVLEQQHEELEVTIEGHTDQRGTTEYNLALGERRANAVKQYLASLNIDPARVLVISYGKERPVAVDHRLFTDHTGMREEMDTFESIYGELKRELMRWLAKRM